MRNPNGGQISEGDFGSEGGDFKLEHQIVDGVASRVYDIGDLVKEVGDGEESEAAGDDPEGVRNDPEGVEDEAEEASNGTVSKENTYEAYDDKERYSGW